VTFAWSRIATPSSTSALRRGIIGRQARAERSGLMNSYPSSASDDMINSYEQCAILGVVMDVDSTFASGCYRNCGFEFQDFDFGKMLDFSRLNMDSRATTLTNPMCCAVLAQAVQYRRSIEVVEIGQSLRLAERTQLSGFFCRENAESSIPNIHPPTNFYS
jgi:hypothetical protein